MAYMYEENIAQEINKHTNKQTKAINKIPNNLNYYKTSKKVSNWYSNTNLIITGIKLNMHIKLISTQVIHTHGYNTGMFAIIPHLPMYTVYLKLLIFDIRNSGKFYINC